MRRGTFNKASLGSRSWHTLLLATLLCGAQLLVAVHTVDHLDSSSVVGCDVCLVGQHIDSALAAGSAAPPLLAGDPPAPPELITAPAEHPTPAPRQRGPPRHPRIV